MAINDQATARQRTRHERNLTRPEPPTSRPPSSPAPTLLRRLTAGGTTGNEQLTALTGLVLIVLFAALGVTILRVRPLLSEHMFIGLLLIPPVALKLASTGYRFARYYTANPRYRRKGAPPTALRMLAPVLVAATVVVFASGVALLLAGPSFSRIVAADPQGELHRVDSRHRDPRARSPARDPPSTADEARAPTAAEPIRQWQRRTSPVPLGALVAGLVLAILYIPQFSPWLNAHH